MDFTPFLKIKPDVEAAIVSIDKEVEQVAQQLTELQAEYDFITTQANRLRTVLAYLNEIEHVV